ncbi:MAG: glycosyltransferase family 4 protein [Bacteroidaceae bacterium]|nr:glycosyltransferase family 4 protein [Bacteroidaceae bacterium]
MGSKAIGSTRILVVVKNDLVTDARVHKVCTSLHQKGYQVCLMGHLPVNGKSPMLKRPYATHRFRIWQAKGPLAYAEFNIRLLWELLFRRFDLILSNDTDSLPACYVASRLKRKNLVFDAHELFPELPEVVDRPRIQYAWKKIEDLLFPHLKYCYTVCQSIADYYHTKYDMPMKVVRNIPWAATEELKGNALVECTENQPSLEKKQKVLLYQGAVNVGRGVDWLIQAMPYLPECRLVVCGGGDLLEAMKQLAEKLNLSDRVTFMGRVPQEELARYTAEADAGFVLLEKMGLSYYYALPNRIFDYMRYGVPVLATDFPEIARIVEESHCGTLLNHYEPTFLADEIRKLLADWESPESRKMLQERAKAYSWEAESAVMQTVVAEALR